MDWRRYEQQILEVFRQKYPESEIFFDQHVEGRHSKILRQVDILVKFQIAGVEGVGAFDCKCYSQSALPSTPRPDAMPTIGPARTTPTPT